jgi:hypothetical protein
LSKWVIAAERGQHETAPARETAFVSRKGILAKCFAEPCDVAIVRCRQDTPGDLLQTPRQTIATKKVILGKVSTPAKR